MTAYAAFDTTTQALRAHLDQFGLPQPVSVTFNLWQPEVSVQTGGDTPAAELGRLVAWACTMQAVDTRWWHTLDGSLHVTITGRTAGGVRIKAYGGIDYAATAGLVTLPVDQSEHIRVDELEALADLLRDHQTTRGVAA